MNNAKKQTFFIKAFRRDGCESDLHEIRKSSYRMENENTGAGLGCGALFTRFGEGRNDWLYIRSYASSYLVWLISWL